MSFFSPFLSVTHKDPHINTRTWRRMSAGSALSKSSSYCWGSGFSYWTGILHKQTKKLAWSSFVAHCCILLSYRKDSWTPLLAHKQSHHWFLSITSTSLTPQNHWLTWCMRHGPWRGHTEGSCSATAPPASGLSTCPAPDRTSAGQPHRNRCWCERRI